MFPEDFVLRGREGEKFSGPSGDSDYIWKRRCRQNHHHLEYLGGPCAGRSQGCGRGRRHRVRNLDVVMGLENRVVYNFIDVLEGTCRLNQALVRDKRVDNLFLLPAAQTRTKDAVSSEQMQELCGMLRKEFDFILLDSPAGIESGFRNASIGADEALVITTPEVPAVRDADRIIGLLESMGKSPIRLVINRLRSRLVKQGEMLDVRDVLDILGHHLWASSPRTHRGEAREQGKPLSLRDSAPGGPGIPGIASRILAKPSPSPTSAKNREKACLRESEVLRRKE